MPRVALHIGLTFVTAMSLIACASKPAETDSAVYYESSFNDRNRAPASMSPPSDVSQVKSIDPVYMRTQADYYFAMGESLSLEGQHQKAAEAFKMTMVYDSESATVPLRLASEYVKLGLISEALDLAETSIKKNPKLIDGRILLGGLYSSLKMYPKAVDQYEEVIKLDVENTEAPLYLGAVLAELKQYDRAIKNFERLLSNPEYTSPHLVHYYMGRVHTEQGTASSLKLAEKNYQKSLEIKPDFVDAALSLGSVYGKQGDNKKAIAFYKKYQNEAGPSVKIAELLVQHFLEAEDYDSAYEQLEVLEPIVEDSLGVKVKMALILIDKKIYDKAVDKLNEILVLEPDSDKIRFYLAAVYEEIKNFPLAVSHFKKIPASSSYYGEAILHASYLERVMKKTDDALKTVLAGLENKKDMPQLFSLYASLLDEKGDFNRAADVLKDATEKFPENVQLKFFLGTVKDRQGKKDEVVAVMKQVIDLDPEHTQGLNYLAYFYAESGKNLDEAEKLARRALAHDPSDAFVMDTLGWVLYKQGKMPESIRYLETAFKNQPNESIIAEHLGDAYSKFALIDKAKKMYQKAVEFENDSTKITQIKQKLDALVNQEVNIATKPYNADAGKKRSPSSEEK